MRRVATVAGMQGRDLLRRRVALGLLVGLPLLFYLVQVSETLDALVAGGIGVGWVAAASSLFSSLAARRVDARLLLAGYRPVELLAGRLLLLSALAMTAALLFAGLMLAVSRPPEPLLALLAVVLTPVISVPLGLAIAALLPRELEGTMVLIAAIGVQMAVQPPAPFLPLYGPLRLMVASVGTGGAAIAPLVMHAVAVAAVLFAVSAAAGVARMPRRRRFAG